MSHSLPTLPKERLVELWKENFGKTPGRIRPELMLPILAFRVQERAYGGEQHLGATVCLQEDAEAA
jgi:hypothetical protein